MRPSPHPRLLLAALFVVLLIPGFLRAALDQEAIESTVKIFCPTAAEDGKGGLKYDDLPLLADGEMLRLFRSGGSGTGFVINSQGYLMTNNHVVAVAVYNENHKPIKFTEQPQALIYVAQRKGASYFLHKAIVDWQSANLDVAVIHCPTLKANPLPLSFETPHESDHVISCGFPWISDRASEDRATQIKATTKLAELLISIRIKKKETEKGQELSKEEHDAVVQEVMKNTQPVEIEWNRFLTAIDPSLQGWNSSAAALDISAKVNSKEVWKSFFTATVTEGNIEKVMAAQGFGNDEKLASIGLIQHNLDIRHGNSGGPLLNASGSVIGVVGRAIYGYTSGDKETQTLATRVTETEKWLKDHQVAYVTPPWRLSHNFKVVMAVGLAIALALAACLLSLVRSRRTAGGAAGYTTVIEEKVRRQIDAMLAKSAPPSSGSAPQPSAAGAAAPANRAKAGSWLLSGRDSEGRAVRLEITEALLAGSRNEIVIGRSGDQCQLVVSDNSISKQHAQIRRQGAAFVVADKQSANGTAVNGRVGKPFEEMPLRAGDTLTLGEVKLQFAQT